MQVCTSVLWASLAAQFVARFLPAARVPTFIVVLVLGISVDTWRLSLQARGGKVSGLAVFCFLLSRFSLLYAIVLVLGGVIEHSVGDGWGYMFDWYGFVIGGVYVLAYTSFITHHIALEEDLNNPRPIDPEEDARERRRGMHPYI